MTHYVKLVSAAVAAAALIATPALARTTKNRAAFPTYAQTGAFMPFQGSYAAAGRTQPFVGGASPVFSADGRVIGADPDPNIRLGLSRDAWQSEY